MPPPAPATASYAPAPQSSGADAYAAVLSRPQPDPETRSRLSISEKELVNLIVDIFSVSAHANMQYLWELVTDANKKKQGIIPLAVLLANNYRLHTVKVII